MAIYQIGSLITFNYPAVHQMGTKANDRFPQVLVLHTGWDGHPTNNPRGNYLVHGLNFNYLSNDEINLVRMFIDPGFQLKYYENLMKKNPALVDEFDRVIGRAGSAIITNPHDFYIKVIRPFIQYRGWDPYRLYRPDKMSRIRVLQTQGNMMGTQKNGLFGAFPKRDKGKDENQILSDLAKKQTEQEQTHKRILTPAEETFLRKLHGKARDIFNKYKNKFQHSKGPNVRWNMPSFRKPTAKF